MSSALLGLAYGSLFGVFPTVCIEWFGLGKLQLAYSMLMLFSAVFMVWTAHFSENWGYLSLSPMLGGNLFSIMFGRNLDAHAPEEDHGTPHSLHPRAGLPSSHQCLQGRECYVSSVYMTIAACFLSLILSLWAGWKDRKKLLKTRGGERGAVEVVWEGPDDD
jgi:hypothetical protein